MNANLQERSISRFEIDFWLVDNFLRQGISTICCFVEMLMLTMEHNVGRPSEMLSCASSLDCYQQRHDCSKMVFGCTLHVDGWTTIIALFAIAMSSITLERHPIARGIVNNSTWIDPYWCQLFINVKTYNWVTRSYRYQWVTSVTQLLHANLDLLVGDLIGSEYVTNQLFKRVATCAKCQCQRASVSQWAITFCFYYAMTKRSLIVRLITTFPDTEGSLSWNATYQLAN